MFFVAVYYALSENQGSVIQGYVNSNYFVEFFILFVE